ncbi:MULTISPECIES: hypothetical protein [unclassified Pseudoalteromonas]|uniref:hypothetical protein n=1 Tax=unclassified Pseudoalteromonas TaxID=194690 RepID=UPI001319BAD6|nr:MULTISPECIES: hypothetical protein [unclassified Pseudoalteromonas]
MAAQAKKGGYISAQLGDYHLKTDKYFGACLEYVQQQKKALFANVKHHFFCTFLPS